MQPNDPVTYPPRTLQIATICYLGFPLLLFFLLWYRWPFGVATLLLVGMLLYRRRHALLHPTEKVSIGRLSRQLLGFLPILTLLCISGIGGFGHQTPDWIKHNGILNLLIERPWPVRFDLLSGEGILTYYLAYYLPPAIVGKLLGATAGHVALLLWSLLGCWFVYLWMLHITKLRPLFATALFLAFAGFHLFGSAAILTQWYGWDEAMATLQQIFEHDHRHTIAVWGRRLPPFASGQSEILWKPQINYTPNVRQLIWVPQHAIAGWLFSFIIYIAYHKRHCERIVLLVVATAALWSVFVAIGLALLFTLIFTHKSLTKHKHEWREWLSPENGLGLFIGLLQLFYFAGSALNSFVQPLLEPTTFSGFRLYNFSQAFAPNLIVWFMLFELLIWFVPLTLIYRKQKTNSPLLIVAFLVLFFLPFIAYGSFNDLTIRASLPAQSLLMLLVGVALARPQTAKPYKITLIVLLLLSSVSPYVEISRQIHDIQATSYWQIEDASTMRLTQVQRSRTLFIEDDGSQILFPEAVDNLIDQYITPEETIFGRYLVAQRRPQPPEMKPIITQITLEDGEHRGHVALVGQKIVNAELIGQDPITPLIIDLVLQLSGTITQDFGLCVETIHQSGETPLTTCRTIRPEPVFLWTRGELYPFQYRLEIPADFPTGEYTVQLTFRAIEIGMPSIGMMTLPDSFNYE